MAKPTSLNQLHDIKRDLVKRQEGPRTRDSYLEASGILEDLPFLLRDVGATAIALHVSIKESTRQEQNERLNKGLAIYRGIRNSAIPLSSPDSYSSDYLGSHRTVVFWEFMDFLDELDKSPSETARSLYYHRYIKPITTYYAAIRQHPNAREEIIERWEHKIAMLERANTKDVYLIVNRTLLAEYKEDDMSNDAAIILSLPYLVRTFIPSQDSLEDWIPLGKTPKERENSRIFYLAVQHALVVEAKKRMTKRKAGV